jgi:sugar phosphate isomerase/epimerase
MIDRRAFVSGASAALVLSALEARAQAPAADRIGVTTVGLRERFRQTARDAAGADLDLLRWPSFVRETFDVPYVELWSRHFDAQTIGYCEQIRAAADDVGAKIINIQLDPFPEDEPDLAATDSVQRLLFVDDVKRWMDRSAACGAPFLRANTDKPTPGRPFDLDVIADSVRRLAAHGETIGVTILVENHTGYSQDIANVEAVVRAVDHPYCRGLADWGNSSGDTTEARIASLAPLAPLTALVSAKGKTFDETTWEHADYDVVRMTAASERSGFAGVYSVELYAVPGPSDPVAAVKSMIASVEQGIEEARS